MKRCPTCNRTYTDADLSFCIDDGTPLTTIGSGGEATVVTPRNRPEDWNPVAYRPPGSYVPPGNQVRRRRVWPWVVGIAGAFILGILAISIVAAILVPRYLRSREHTQANRSTETPNLNSNVNANRPAISNSNQPTSSNNNSNEQANTPPPADREQVLAQLTDIENEWTAANINADKKKLDKILADDYAGQASEGGLESKAEYIRNIQRNTDVERWEFSGLKVTLVGDRATLTGQITYLGQDVQDVVEFIDKFVWRDGRWQATGSEVKRKSGTNVNYQ